MEQEREGPKQQERDGPRCVVCSVDDRERRLCKCPICFKLVCENCSHRAMGRDFCSKKCADQFFFGDDDE